MKKIFLGLMFVLMCCGSGHTVADLKDGQDGYVPFLNRSNGNFYVSLDEYVFRGQDHIKGNTYVIRHGERYYIDCETINVVHRYNSNPISSDIPVFGCTSEYPEK